ncbi:alpha-2-macroglobulin-P-like [Cheilinus undulatus]|uniref:alpha-2-macroglobulin-P-like n=1 Tax=Cheilinus undulatus TaxID=241271 RepID=UPI001BD2CB64|nr:alpha-2-macroglobulin-P-like [Cheilinus undulatus]
MVALDPDFRPCDAEYKSVVIQDPNSNNIEQWLDLTYEEPIQEFSYALNPFAELGNYIITAVTSKGETIIKTFVVKKFVLPKYEVKVYLPSSVSILEEEVTLRVCGKYTFGRPVSGSIVVQLCGKGLFQWRVKPVDRIDPCKNYKLKTEKNGCATQNVNMTEFFINKSIYISRFEATAELTEEGTGVVQRGSATMTVNFSGPTISFVDSPTSYKPRLPYDVTAQLENEQVHPNPLYRVLYHSGYLRVLRFYSKTNSYARIMHINGRIPCGTDATVDVQYIIQGRELKQEQKKLTFYYMVFSKGELKQHDYSYVDVDSTRVNKGKFAIKLTEVTDLAPYAQVVVYTVMPVGEVVADSRTFPTQLCFNNKVSLKFPSIKTVLPGDNTTLHLKAESDSLCSIRAIDQSLLLLQEEQELDAQYIFGLLKLQKLMGYRFEVVDPESHPCNPLPGPGPVPVPLPRPEPRPLSILPPWIYPIRADSHGSFEDIGVKPLSNLLLTKPCDTEPIPVPLPKVPEVQEAQPEIAPAVPLENRAKGAKEKSKEDVRSNFVETWIWDLVEMGGDDMLTMEKTVPDTITKWVAGAFCVSRAVGFGVSPNIGLTTFKPFFVSLTLPYSVIRGESFTLKATVFSYESKCIRMKITLSNSNQFTYKNCVGCKYSVCLCSGESMTFKWIVTPSVLGQVKFRVSAEALTSGKLCGNKLTTVPDKGRIDTVIRGLLVEAEGMPQMASSNTLLCPSGNPMQEELSAVLPKDFVQGSVRGVVSVVGDLMGSAMKNLGDLLRMPYGCGEQNMIVLAPNIYILNYLKSTNQLTEAIKATGLRFLRAGYGRQLNYKHKDGSFSAFGKRDKSGNTWLTAFVLKSFVEAKEHIFVSPKVIDQARKWLSGLQGSDGCFKSVGKLFHNGMKGGVKDEVTLTAYIVAAMLEMNDDATDPVVRNGLRCLKDALKGKVNNQYTIALLAYAFSLAKDKTMRKKLLEELDKKADKDAGSIHLHRDGASHKRPDALEVEMTSYFLMAVLTGPPEGKFNLGYASLIIRWLVKQQNPRGGFSSTQDTVVALQALAKYGSATYSGKGTVLVTVTSAKGNKNKFTVDETNRLLYQDKALRDVPGKFTVKAEGKGCVLVQISIFFNTPPDPDRSSFDLSTRAQTNCRMNPPELTIFVQIRFQGKREETNMIILNIKVLSGFRVKEDSLQQLQRMPLVKNVELTNGHIFIYLDGMKKGEVQRYSMTMLEDEHVKDRKAAVVESYDYYDTADRASTEYNSKECKEGVRPTPTVRPTPGVRTSPRELTTRVLPTKKKRTTKVRPPNGGPGNRNPKKDKENKEKDSPSPKDKKGSDKEVGDRKESSSEEDSSKGDGRSKDSGKSKDKGNKGSKNEEKKGPSSKDKEGSDKEVGDRKESSSEEDSSKGDGRSKDSGKSKVEGNKGSKNGGKQGDSSSKSGGNRDESKRNGGRSYGDGGKRG